MQSRVRFFNDMAHMHPAHHNKVPNIRSVTLFANSLERFLLKFDRAMSL